jgi:hypothetical protein
VTAGVAGLVGGAGSLLEAVLAEQLSKTSKQVLVVNLAGGLSQLESWDPKPATDTGGPFRAIATSVPGTHISELLPETAKQMHHLALIRSINTKEDDHARGRYMMFTGRRRSEPGEFPEIGAVAAKALGARANRLPGHIHITPGGGGGRSNDAAYLGPEFASISLGNGAPPQFTERQKALTESADWQRNEFRRRADERFLAQRRTAMTDAYVSTYEQASELMARREVFDVTKESPQDQSRYGGHDFGRHCLLARRLLENGVTYVQVTHSNYDTHYENFNFHIEQLQEFDAPFAHLVSDIVDRGMLDSTLIVVLTEFGRTPRINQYYGRDHWGTSWSICLGGAGIQPGAVIGKTNANGTQVVDREVEHGHLFHTFLQAVGVDSTGHFDIDGREVPIANPAYGAIEELLV